MKKRNWSIVAIFVSLSMSPQVYAQGSDEKVAASGELELSKFQSVFSEGFRHNPCGLIRKENQKALKAIEKSLELVLVPGDGKSTRAHYQFKSADLSVKDSCTIRGRISNLLDSMRSLSLEP